jgi:hypothetical protein
MGMNIVEREGFPSAPGAFHHWSFHHDPEEATCVRSCWTALLQLKFNGIARSARTRPI